MSGQFGDLPKYPGESEADRAKLLDVLRPEPPAPPDSLRDRLRHLFPVLVLGTGLAFGGFVALGLAILLLVKAVDAGLTVRPVEGTVADTWAWLQTTELPTGRPGMEPGLPEELERRLLG